MIYPTKKMSTNTYEPQSKPKTRFFGEENVQTMIMNRNPFVVEDVLDLKDSKYGQSNKLTMVTKPILSLPTTNEIEAVKPIRHETPVQKNLNGLKLHPGIKEFVPTLVMFNDMAYALGKRQTQKWEKYKTYFERQGWQIKALPGVTGKKESTSTDDIGAILAYHRERNVMTIVFRGSQLLPGESPLIAKDWQTNFSRETCSTSKPTSKLYSLLPPHVFVHRGYAFRAGETVPIIEKYVKVYWTLNKENGEEQKNREMKFIFTGHSQGSALGTLALASVVYHLGKQLYGSNFNNAETNQFSGYFFSTARSVARKKSAQIIQELIGKHNIVNQNVEGDPIPHTMTGIKLPWLKKYGWKDIGYLALDKTRDVKKRRPKEVEKLILKQKSLRTLRRLKDKLAPLHYGSRFHLTSTNDKEFIFDPLLTDTTGELAAILPDVLGGQYPKMTDLIKAARVVNSLDKKRCKDIDELLNQGKKKWSWLAPKEK